jgi:septum site-determining protein MinC
MSKQRKKGWKNEEYFFGFFLVKAGIEKPQIENIYRKKWDWREQHPGMVDLVTIKGKRSGLIIELDTDEDFQRVLNRFVEKLQEADNFLEGSTVSIDVGTRNFNLQQLSDLRRILVSHKLHLRCIMAGNRGKDQGVKRVAEDAKEMTSWRSRRKKKNRKTKAQVETQEETAATIEASHTMEEQPCTREYTLESEEIKKGEKEEEKEDIPVILYTPVRQTRDDIISQEQTILVQRTIRSGQRVFYPGNVVVLGDVNPGGEVIAGGNIIVMGTFRGIAHAGALGRDDVIVAALRLEPAQLRIAGYITRAPEGDFSIPFQPEIARVEDGIVIIEQYQPGYDRNHRGDHKGGA